MIQQKIAETRKLIEDRLAASLTTKEQIDNLRRSLDIEFDEYVKFQELKSLAVADGSMSLEDGQYIYNVLGEGGPEKFNQQDIVVKVVLTQVFLNLIQKQIEAAHD